MKIVPLEVCKNEPSPYSGDKAFLADLKEVFSKDYGVTFSDQELAEVGRNIDAFLGAFCRSFG